jgi:hypothetical protein
VGIGTGAGSELVDPGAAGALFDVAGEAGGGAAMTGGGASFGRGASKSWATAIGADSARAATNARRERARKVIRNADSPKIRARSWPQNLLQR